MITPRDVQEGADGKKTRWTYTKYGVTSFTNLSVFVLIALVFSIVVILPVCLLLFMPTPENHTWAAVMDAHPDAGMACQAALVDRIEHMTGVLYRGPYAAEDPSTRPSMGVARELATGMVLEGDWRPPECGG